MDQINKYTFYQLVRAGFKTQGKNSRSGRLFPRLLSTKLFGKMAWFVSFLLLRAEQKFVKKALIVKRQQIPLFLLAWLYTWLSALIPLSLKALMFTLLIRRLSLAVSNDSNPSMRFWGVRRSLGSLISRSRQPRIRWKLKMKILLKNFDLVTGLFQ